MKNKLFRFKTLVVGLACGAIPLITEATCDPYGAYFFRDDDADYYDDGFYYYEDPFFYDPYCDPFFCY